MYIMDNDNIKRVLELIDIKNLPYEDLTKKEKKEYLKLLKSYNKYKNFLHLLPKKDIKKILKNNFDYEKNKKRINKIVEKIVKKETKIKNDYYNSRIKSCERFINNKKVRMKEAQLYKTTKNKKTKKYETLKSNIEHLKYCKNLIKKNKTKKKIIVKPMDCKL